MHRGLVYFVGQLFWEASIEDIKRNKSYAISGNTKT